MREASITAAANEGLPGTVEICRHVVAARRGEDTVLLDIRKGTYYTLNDTGTAVWARLNDKLTPAAIATELATEYAITRTEAAHDVAELLTALRKAGLIKCH